MIREFIASFELFGATYAAGWLLAALLPLIGVLVVARDQIFLGAALSQASILGVATGLRIASLPLLATIPWLHSDLVLSAFAACFTIAAALMTARAGTIQRESHESLTGWVFLVGASLSVLLLSHSPHGMEEIHRLVASTIIGATPSDVAVFGLLTFATAALLLQRHRELVLLAMDPLMAEAVGLRVARWETFSAVWLGIVVGLANRVAGAVFTFACLVLPALAARALCREVRSMFLVAPALSVAASALAFLLAHDRDYPPGQAAAFVLSLVLAAAWGVRRFRHEVLPG